MEQEYIINSIKYLPWLILAYIIHKYVISLWLKIYFYKKQFGNDFVVEYFPYIGLLNRMRQGRKNHGDCAYYWKEFTRTHPGKKGIISNIGYKPVIEIVDIPFAKEYIASIYGNFTGDRVYFTNVFLQMKEKSLGDMEGLMWKQHRKLMGYAFNFENLKKYTPVVRDITNEYLDKWIVEDASNKKVENFKNRISFIVGEVLLRTFFGMSFVGEIFEDVPLHMKLLEFRERAGLRQKSARVIMTGFWITRLHIFKEDREIYNGYHNLKKFFIKKIEERKQKILNKENLDNPHLKGSKCFLDYILEIHLEEIQIMKQGGKIDHHLTIDQISIHLMGLIAGSMDNIAHYMSCVLYKLSLSDKFHDNIYQETSSLFNSEDPQLHYENLQEFKYLDAFLKESLRFYTPTPTQRQKNASKNFNIGKIKILKDTIIYYFGSAQMFSDEHYEKPNEFIPDRWLQESPPYKDAFAFAPFGIGQRNCIGQHFSVIMHKVILAIITAKCSKVELIDKIDRLVMVNRLTYEPEIDLTFRFTKRI